ncbi:IPT domain [Dillenia turbinata]|uniref:IPT domain n=1 Tax=Dillenia turbinata TaxID=194707 RepID=A0AAN8UWQ4_9MAGN
MAEPRRYGLGNQLDIEQILMEAQNRWLRPAEICEILRNYKKFRITPEPPNMPSSGSLFLFDRKVLRYFRKDGHNWRKKKDGKTVKEAHEKLKAGSVDVLHCYYAHGEESESFQRRSYWMLEEELSHIVLVHYREVKGNRTNFNRIRDAGVITPSEQDSEEHASNSEIDSSMSYSFQQNSYHLSSQNTDTVSMKSTQASEFEDAESAYNHQPSSTFHSFLDPQQPQMENMDAGLQIPYYPAPFTDDYQGKLTAVPGLNNMSVAQVHRGKENNDAGVTYEPRKHLDFSSWKDVYENCASIQSFPFQEALSVSQSNVTGITPKNENDMLTQLLQDSFSKTQALHSHTARQEEWQASEDGSSHMSKWTLNQKLPSESSVDVTTRFEEQGGCPNLLSTFESTRAYADQVKELPLHKDFQVQPISAENERFLKLESEGILTTEGELNYSIGKHPLLDSSLTEDGLKKLDSFNRWMSKELGDVNSHVKSSTGAYWDTVDDENGVEDSSISPQAQLETYTLGPSLSQDQLFSIIDFSPNWAYSGSETKVLVTGKFLKGQQDAEKCKWSCMFGEIEVPADVIADGVLRCYIPTHVAGRVPFYVTCSNRLACSEVREFEYRVNPIRDMEITDVCLDAVDKNNLYMRFGKLLSMQSVHPPDSSSSNEVERSHLSSKISSLLKEEDDEWSQMWKLTSEEDFSPDKVKEQLINKLLKEKLHVWLVQKAAEGGKGPSVLDEGGQGVLHFAAALGCDWAIPPTLVAGVNVNFRDANGWTALHWAAYCGSERTVVSLISLGAAPGALTDPTPKYPSGRTPADLASSNGHKGIAGYLAEAALSKHLLTLNLKDPMHSEAVEISGVKAVETVSERSSTSIDVDVSHGVSMKDSLAAVRNATQAAARIYQVFRVQSFQKKQIKEYGNEKLGMSDECALSMLALKSHKPGLHDEPVHAAAIRIQNKFRSWKGRKDYLIIRQRIIKIQAHVRGHQVRKNYKKIIWSVGILEKVILRWRRKGSGLRGFKPEAITEGTSRQNNSSSKEDDDDFYREGRKQTEERLQKALARVKSMVQYPEARDQYSRLLNAVAEIQETKVMYDSLLNSSEETACFDDDLIDLEALLGDDTFMSTS